MTGDQEPYKVLQVDPEAEDEVIQAAYRRLARKYHPDVAAGPDGASRMAAINAAWEVLRDPGRRAAHDLARRVAAEAAARTATGPASPPTAGRSARAASGGSPTPGPGGSAPRRAPETVSADWTSGRSSQGGGYDPSRMGAPDGLGAAGPPPGGAAGTVLGFGRYAGWSLGEIARRDLDYIEWLDRMPIGRPYRDELDALLRRAGRRRSAPAEAGDRRGLFRRR